MKGLLILSAHSGPHVPCALLSSHAVSGVDTHFCVVVEVPLA